MREKYIIVGVDTAKSVVAAGTFPTEASAHRAMERLSKRQPKFDYVVVPLQSEYSNLRTVGGID